MPHNQHKEIAVLWERVDNFLQKNTEDHQEMKQGIDRIEKLVGNHLSHLDNKYATKTTQYLVYGAAGIILTAVFSAIVYLVVK